MFAAKRITSPEVPILLTIDFDGEVGMAAIHGWNQIFWVSRGEFEGRVGVKRLLNLLEKEQVKATFCVVGQIAERWPSVVKSIANAGHEIAAHGWTHRGYVDLQPEEEEEEIIKTKEILEKLTGEVIMGHRTPLWNPSSRTLPLLIKHGFQWNSDFLNDELPYLHTVDGKQTRLVEIPPNFALNDWAQLIQFRQDPRAMFETWKDELEVLHREGKIFCLTLHPLDIGRGSRTVWLERIIQEAKGLPNTRFISCGELAREFLSRQN